MGGASGTPGTPSASLSVALRPQIVCPRLFSHGEKGLPQQVGRFLRPCTRSTASPGVSGHTRGTQAVATDTQRSVSPLRGLSFGYLADMLTGHCMHACMMRYVHN